MGKLTLLAKTAHKAGSDDEFIQAPGWRREGSAPLALGPVCVVCGRDANWVNVERQADGSYQAELCGHFRLQVADDKPFRTRWPGFS
jgi:hypothetical protein